MQELSKDLIQHLGQYLAPSEIGRLSQTNSNLYYELLGNPLWIYRLVCDFGIRYDFSKSSSPKSLYRYIYQRIKEPKTITGLNSLLVDAVTENDIDLLNACLHVGSDPGYSTYLDAPDSCITAINCGNLRILSFLIRLIPEITKDEINYLFCWAAEHGDIPIVAFLMGYGADSVHEAIDGAIATDNIGVVDYIRLNC